MVKKYNVYLIQNGITKNIKIGVSKDPELRLKTLKTGNDCPLSLLYTLEAEDRDEAYLIEKCLHSKYAENQIISEWFSDAILNDFPHTKTELLQTIHDVAEELKQKEIEKAWRKAEKAKKKERESQRALIIREAYRRIGINSDKEICETIGLDYNRFHKRRMKDIGSMRLNELWLLQRHAHFTDEELLQLIKEG